MADRYAYSCNGFIGSWKVNVERPFRPTHIYTDVDREGEGTIDGIWIAGRNELIQPIDAYFFSRKRAGIIRNEFLTEYGLANATLDELDDFLESNGFSLPDPNAILLPTLHMGAELRVTGVLSDKTISVVGWRLEDE